MFFNKSKSEKQRQAQIKKNHDIAERDKQLERNKHRLAEIASDLDDKDISANCDRLALTCEAMQLYTAMLPFIPANTLECGMTLSLEWTLYRSRNGALSFEYSAL